MSKKKIDAALKEFQDSMGYDDGIIARKRGGYMRYGNKFATGSVKNYGYQNVIEEEVEEPELDALIEKYKRTHPFAEPWREQNINALAGAGLSALNQAQQTMGYDSYMKGLRKHSDIFNVTDNDALLNWDANNPTLSQSRVTDFRNKSWWDDTKSALSTGLSAGMATANPLVGLGAAGLSFLGSLAGRGIAAYNSKKANEAIDDLNYQRDINFSKAGDNVDAANDLRRMMAYANRPFEYALGGEMRSHGQTWNNGLTFINEGGTHEENPLEGVPSGVDNEGIPNLVEEGEVIWNNEYVFSNRLKVPEELKKKYKLGGDLTFADAIKKVTKESLERPNDPISNETNRAITNEFMDAQEALREEQQAKAARNLQRAYDEDFMEQLAMLGQPEAPMVGQGIQMPQQGIVQEGMPVEGAPIGFAFGGNKFDDGSWKQYYTVGRDENGATIYIAPDGQIFYSDNGAERYARLNSGTWVAPSNITENGFRAPSTTGGNGALGASIGGGSRGYRPDNLPEGLTPIYSKGVNGNQGRVHHYETSEGKNVGSDVNRAIQAQLAINNGTTQRNVAQVSSPERTTVQSSTTNRNPRNVSSEQRQSTAQRTQSYNTTTQSRPTQQSTSAEPTQTTSETNENTTTNRVFQVDQNTKGARALELLKSLGINPNIEGLTKAEVEDLAKRVAKVYKKESKKASTLKEGSPRYNEVMQSALSAARNSFREESAKLNAERSAARKATEESLAKTQREVDAKKYLENRGYTAQSTITKEDRQIYKDILSGKRNSDGSIRKPSQQQTSSQPVSPKRYPVSTFDNRITEGNYPETFGIGNLNDAIEQSVATQQGITVQPSTADIKFKDDKSRKAAENYLRNRGVSNYGELTNTQKAEYARIAAGNTGGGGQGRRSSGSSSASKIKPKVRDVVVPDVQLNEFDPNIDYNNEVSTDEINAAIEAANNNPNTPPTTTQQASGLRYKPTWQRDVPIWAGLAGATYGMAGSPDYTNADAIIAAAREAGVPINIPVQTIGDYRTRRPFDERYLVNMANQNRVAGERTLRNTSGGNRAMDILGASALAFNNQQELGEIMRQAYLANRQDDAQVAEFNRGTNLYNMQATNQRNMTQAHLNSQRQLAALSGLERGYATRQAIKDAWDAATMESLNSAIASIGLKGRENEQDNMLMSMAEQGYSPFYWGDRGIVQFLPKTTAKKGGKLNKKKRRF